MAKNFQNRKNGSNAADPKRYSKSKFNHEVLGENAHEEKPKTVKSTPKEQRDYRSAVIPEKYQFRGTPQEVFSATLTKPSFAQKGYVQLNKGQMVTVEDFGGDQPLRVTAMDKRVGVADHSIIKRLSFA